MLLLRVPEQIRTFEHPRHSFDCRDVQRDDAMARLVLAPSNVDEPLGGIHIAETKMLHLDRPHRVWPECACCTASISQHADGVDAQLIERGSTVRHPSPLGVH